MTAEKRAPLSVGHYLLPATSRDALHGRGGTRFEGFSCRVPRRASKEDRAPVLNPHVVPGALESPAAVRRAPATAMPSKVEATKRQGGEVVQTTGGLLDLCLALRPDRALTLVHPFDDLAIMGGQGAVGLELLDQVPRVDMIVVPIGGGGLISGIAAAVKLRHPSVRVVGVEPEGADVMSRSLMQGVPVHMENADTVADGFASPFAGEHAFRHVQRFVDEVVR
jgi:threonine dehydratase